MSCDLEFPSDGLQSGYANTNASLTQDGLATIEDGVTYTLEVDVGRRSDDSNSTCCTALDFAVSLLAAGDPVATNDENAIAGGIPNPGAFGTLTLSFTGTPATAGQSLGIELASFADQTNWDDVRLESEPGSGGQGGGGGSNSNPGSNAPCDCQANTDVASSALLPALFVLAVLALRRKRTPH